MPRKLFKVEVELHIQAVTCPGVWLCPNGKVSLQIYMLDSCVQTSSIEPVFPLLCHEKFLFCKVYDKAQGLSDLQRSLSKECFYAELIQWKNCEVGNVLATFQTSLHEVLYPTVVQGAIAGVDVDLLMEPSKRFPGIIAPKIEVSTCTIVEETLCTVHQKKCSPYVINPKTVTSCRNDPAPGRARQKKVCHSIGYHRSRRSHIRQHSKRCKAPPFQYQKVDEELIARKPQGLEDKPKYPCKCLGHSRSSIRAIPSLPQTKSYTDITEEFLKNYSQCVDQKRRNVSQTRAKKCTCGRGHKEPNCPVCAKYKYYFDDTPIHSTRQKPEIRSCESQHRRRKCGCPCSKETNTVEMQPCKYNEGYDDGGNTRVAQKKSSYFDTRRRNYTAQKEVKPVTSGHSLYNEQECCECNDGDTDEGNDYGDDVLIKKRDSKENVQRPCVCTAHGKESLAEKIHKRLRKTLGQDRKDSDPTDEKLNKCPCPPNEYACDCKDICCTLDKFYGKLYGKIQDKVELACENSYCVPTCSV